ncbi:MAG: hypothetical protein RBT11_08740 [Desulfobacterales bacterium]|jgi:DNA-directed RNA polymerase specialized sigma24 family protein|nr:hypothetical protein [Desulfobacterales bacterium]
MPRYKDAYDPSIHKHLDKVDWDAVLPAVLKYARWRVQIFHWLGKDMDPESLVREAFARAYGIGTNGTYRNWNKKTCPDIAIFLKGIIRSMTSHNAEHESEFPTESLFYEDGSPKDDKIFGSSDETVAASRPKTPEDELIESENLRVLMNELDQISCEDDDLGMVILCFEEGISKPQGIAAQTGFEVNEVNNLLKRLRRKLKQFNPKLQEQSSIERREEWA